MIDYIESLLWICFCGSQARIESVRAILTACLKNVSAKYNLWAHCDEIKCKYSEYAKNFENLTNKSKEKAKKINLRRKKADLKNFGN